MLSRLPYRWKCRLLCDVFSLTLTNNKWPPGEIQVAIILCPRPIYILTLLRSVHIDQNARFLLTLQYEKSPRTGDRGFLCLIDGDLRDKIE